MTTFGEQLRIYRQRCDDPALAGRRLSQERLGELLGGELGLRQGYSGAAVSDWERGRSRIHADERRLLVGLLKILYQLGGIDSLDEANELLDLGNYRALDPDEVRRLLLGETGGGLPKPVPPSGHGLPETLRLFAQRAFFISGDELNSILAHAAEGPSPSWPRIVIALLRSYFDRWSAQDVLRIFAWLWLGLLAWGLLLPMLRWPFANREQAEYAVVAYTCGSLILPMLVGALTNTKNNPFWQAQGLSNSIVTRLYTHQGSSMGFHLAYFFVLLSNLVRFYLHIRSSIALQLIAVSIILIITQLGALVIPYNLWLAYHRLRFSDGAIAFSFVLIGPLWGVFFFNTYPVLLSSALGGITILLSVTCTALGSLQFQLRANRSSRSKLPGGKSQ